MRFAREMLELTQEACATRIRIERSTLVNYELGRTPLRYTVALRFCRQLILSEEWLATGKFEAMEKAAVEHGMKSPNDSALVRIFRRQCMDLLSDPIVNTIPHAALFSEAWNQQLAPRYFELARRSFYTPRIIFSGEAPEPELADALVSAYFERWMIMLENEALRRKVNPWRAQRQFAGALISSGGFLFKKFIETAPDASLANELGWLKAAVTNPKTKLGPLHSSQNQSVPTADELMISQ